MQKKMNSVSLLQTGESSILKLKYIKKDDSTLKDLELPIDRWDLSAPS